MTKSLWIVLFFLVLNSCTLSGKISGVGNLKLDSESSSDADTGLKLSVSDQVVNEYGMASVVVSLNRSSTSDVSFSYYTQDGTAIDGSDYFSVSGTKTIFAGQTQVSVPVSVIDNISKTANKNFLFNLLNPINVAIKTASSQVQIQDDDYNPMTDVVQISAGMSHTCVLKTNNDVRCWGSNQWGQLGNGTTVSSTQDILVSGLGGTVSSIAAGNSYTCALLSTGAVKCWGGINGTTSPTDIAGWGSGVTQLSAGTSYVCALKNTATIECFGNNDEGQLGNGNTTYQASPVVVSGITTATKVAAGNVNTCAILTGGAAKCWGYNFYGSVGDGTTTDRLTPANVSGLGSGVVDISTSGAANGVGTCAVLNTGAVKCWGANTHGKVGDGTTSQRNSPTNVSGLATGASLVSVGTAHACAMMSSGSVKCWGNYGNMARLGNGNIGTSSVPVTVSGISTATSISLMNGHACVTLVSTGASCWGDNTYAQTGDMIMASRSFALSLAGNFKVQQMALGESHSCFLTTAGAVKCIGLNSTGQLGNGTQVGSSVIVNVSGLSSGVVQIAVGKYHSCALTTAGAVTCWGYNSDGQLGDNTTTFRTAPVAVSGLSSGVVEIAAGNNHTCALMGSGTMKCWGENANGQIGDGTSVGKLIPTDVTGLSGTITKIAAGVSSSCALFDTGGLMCWGTPAGNGSLSNALSPVAVTGLSSGVSKISMGTINCAIMTTGQAKCWGTNVQGQIGNGNTTDRVNPTNVSVVPASVVSIASKDRSSCAVLSTGQVKCWGENDNGQLGNNSTTDSLSAVNVLGLDSGITAIAAGRWHYCAQTESGDVKCWGQNTYFQAGANYSNAIPNTVLTSE